MTPTSKYPYVYECQFCHGPAFYLQRVAMPGESVRATDSMKIDGNVPREGDPLVCGSCAKMINILIIPQIKMLI